MNEIELKGLKGSYGVCNNFLFFTAEDGTIYKMTKMEALEIVYTLYDSLGLPYTEPEKLEDVVAGEEGE